MREAGVNALDLSHKINHISFGSHEDLELIQNKFSDGICTVHSGYFSFNNRGMAAITPQSPIPKQVLHNVKIFLLKYSSGIYDGSELENPKLLTFIKRNLSK